MKDSSYAARTCGKPRVWKSLGKDFGKGLSKDFGKGLSKDFGKGLSKDFGKALSKDLGKGNFFWVSFGQSSKLTDQLIWMGKRKLNICIYIL